LLGHQLFQLQQLAGQRGQDAQQRQVVVQVALAAADAVAGEHADGHAVELDGQRDEGHGLRRQLGARHGAEQEQRLGVHVLHDGGQPAGQHPAGDALAPAEHAARGFGGGQAVGVADRRGALAALADLVGQHHAPAVQAQQLAHQVQHLAQHVGRRQAAAHELHDLAHEQQLLGVPVGGGVGAQEENPWPITGRQGRETPASSPSWR
jgi:hypothetical protein